MTELKPLGSLTSPSDTKSEFVKAVSAKPKSEKKTKILPFKKLSDPQSQWLKLLLYGHSGSGKTYFIVGLLRAGLKVLVISTDLGGNGLNSVVNALKDSGEKALLENIFNADLSTYEEISDFIDDPEDLFPEIYNLDIDMVVWDGFSGYQQVQLADYIGNMTPSKSDANSKGVSEARESGLQFETQDWGMVRNGTLRPLNKFLSLHNKKTGKLWNKLVTCLESAPVDDKLTKETYKGPLVQGAARSLMAPAFDLIFETKVKTVKDAEESRREYSFLCVGHDKLLAKNRGYNVDPVEVGDSQKLWAKLMEKK